MYFLFGNVPESKNIEITKFVTDIKNSINGFGHSILNQIKQCILRIILLVTKRIVFTNVPTQANLININDILNNCIILNNIKGLRVNILPPN